MGDSCHFAHGDAELRNPNDVPFTLLIKSYINRIAPHTRADRTRSIKDNAFTQTSVPKETLWPADATKPIQPAIKYDGVQTNDSFLQYDASVDGRRITI